MSTIKTTFIQHPSAEGPAIALNADGTVALPLTSLEDLSNVSGTPAMGETLTYDGTGWVPAARSRNAIINGAFNVFQRGTSFTINSGTYGADRWVAVLNSSVWSRAEDAPAGVGTFSLRLRRDTGTIAGAGQRIESFNSAPLAGQEVTLSFWMREEVANGHNTRFRIDRAGSLNNFTSPVEVVGTTTIGTLTTAWQRFSTTFTLTPECSLGILVSIFAGASFEDFRLTGVQLETGPVATPFQFEDVGTTLAKCQRYLYVHCPGFVGDIGTGYYVLTTELQCHVRFPVTMRTAPTGVVGTGTGAYTFIMGDINSNVNSLTVFSALPDVALLFNTSAPARTAGVAGRFIPNSSDAFIAFSAEL